MQHPWTQFATNYNEKGSYQTPSYMYPSSPSQSKSFPSYNRSPAPFNPAATQQPPSPQYQPQMNGFQQDEPVFYQQNQEAQYYEQDPGYGYEQQQQFEYVQPVESSQRVKNIREDPDIDEDFPSYKDLRNVFLRKQKQAEQDERRAHTLPRQKSGQPSVIRKPPPPPQKPTSNYTTQRQQSSRQTTTVIPVNVASPQKPRRAFSQVKQQNATSNSFNAQPYNQQQHQSQSNAFIQNHSPSNSYSATSPVATSRQYHEIPVRHVQGPDTRWQHIKPQRDAVRYRPPMHINVSSPHERNESAPRVVITSNSPQSPQKAVYRSDDGFEQDPWQQVNRRASVAFSSPAVVTMRSDHNKPRRRASYAEIMITHNAQQPPPQLLRRSVSHSSQNISNGFDDNVEVFPRQRRYNTIGSFRRKAPQQQMDTYSTSSWETGISNPTGAHGFSRIKMRHPSMDQMLYASSADNQDFRQQQTGGWNQGHPGARMGPHVSYSANANQPGKTAAHLQYNSPMALYSTQNAQQALANDQEAAELLKISGPAGGGPAIASSPTLRAVLREDQVKRQTGVKPSVGFYHNKREYGPGYGPLRQYEEIPDTLRQSITSYNQKQDRSLSYPMWNE